MLERATRNAKTRRDLTLKTQTCINSSSKKPENLELVEPKLKILERKSSLIYARTRQFETRYKVGSARLGTSKMYKVTTQSINAVEN